MFYFRPDLSKNLAEFLLLITITGQGNPLLNQSIFQVSELEKDFSIHHFRNSRCFAYVVPLI